jgi:hypothetical protein
MTSLSKTLMHCRAKTVVSALDSADLPHSYKQIHMPQDNCEFEEEQNGSELG